MSKSTITVVKYDITDSRMGRHVEHDEKSKAFLALPKQAKPKGKNTHWTSQANPLNQGKKGSCTGNGLAQWLNTDFASGARAGHFRVPTALLTEDDALNFYHWGTVYDSIPGTYPPDDTGSSGNAVCKGAVKQGSWLKSYSWLMSYTSTQAQIELSPLMAGTLWTNDMFNPNNGLVKVGSVKDSNIAGGHEYLMSGIDWTAEVFEFRNSWGDQKDWPGCKPGGYFAIGFKDFRTLLDNQGDITVPKWS